MKKKSVGPRHTTPTKPAHAGSGITQEKTTRSLSTAYAWMATGVFALFSYALLTGCYSDYMHKIESLSIFLPTASFFSGCMALPGGFLTWLGSFLTMSMHTPPLGAGIFTLLLIALIWIAGRAFRLRRQMLSAGIIPSALILLSMVNFGYLVYTIRPLGYVFALPLGVIVSVLLYWGVDAMKQWWLRGVGILTIVAVGYPFLGFYALFAALLCCLGSLRTGDGRSWMGRLGPCVLGIVTIVAVPRIWWMCRGGDLIESQIYVSGLPRFFARETWMKTLYAAVFVSVAVFPAVRILPAYLRWAKAARWMPAAVCAGAMAMVWTARYADDNFMLGLKLDRLIWDGDFAGAADAAKKVDFKLTRANTMLAYIAMMRTGEMGTSMFDIPYGYEPYNTTRDARSIFDVCGTLASYHLGMPNYAYRWGMEYTLEQGLTVERLKIMAKCALLNREPALARTYLDILYNVPTHRQWAAEYLRYADNPALMMSDPEILDIMPLMCHTNEFVNDQGSLEGYVWNLLACAGEGTPQFNELGMQAALITMDLNAFMCRLPAYAATHRRLPPVYQQAALLWSLLENQPCPVDIDPAVRNAHDDFRAAFRRVSGMSDDEQRREMSRFFADTYWYYFIFMSDHRL